MTKDKNQDVTMRIRIGNNELEVTGPEKFVEEKISEFIKDQKTLQVPEKLEGKSYAAIKGEPENARKKMAISQLMKVIRPKTDVDRVLVAAYYLERVESQDSFTAAEVRNQIRAAKKPPPKNPSDAINQNIKKGLIMAAGEKDSKKAFVLTSDGEQTIEDLINSAE